MVERSRFGQAQTQGKTTEELAKMPLNRRRFRAGVNVVKERQDILKARAEVRKKKLIEEENRRKRLEYEEAVKKREAQIARQKWFQKQIADLKTKYEGQPQDFIRNQMTPAEAAIYIKLASDIQHENYSQTTASIRANAVVSESILLDLRERAKAGDETAQEALVSVKSYVPQEQIDAAIKQNQIVAEQPAPETPSKYQQAENYFSKKTTALSIGIAEFLGAPEGTKLSTATKEALLSPTHAEKRVIEGRGKEFEELYYKATKKQRELEAGILSGYVIGLEEKPVKAAATTAAFFVLPKGLKIIGQIPAISYIASTPLGKGAGATISAGLPILYGTSIVKRVSSTPGGTLEKSQTLGEIGSTEITPMLTGTYLGTKYWPKIEGWWATRGRKEIPIEQLVPKDVLSGKKRFVESSSFGYKGAKSGKGKQSFDYKTFLKTKEAYHATPEKFWKEGFVVTKGSSEYPGLYVAPKTSPYFLKVQGTSSAYGGEIFSPYGSPGIAKIKGIKYTKSPTGKPGTAFVTGVKPEIEAVVQTGTPFTKVDTSTFFTWKGQNIPIDVFQFGGTGIGGSPTTAGGISSSYTGIPSSSYLSTPSSLFLASLFSSKSSKPSSPTKPSYSYSPKFSYKSYSPSYKSSSKTLSYKSPTSISSVSKPSYSSTSFISRSSSGGSSGYNYSGRSSGKKKTTTSILGYFKGKAPKKQKERVSLQIKRHGKFKTIKRGLTFNQALNLGSKKVSNTLAAQFRIRNVRGGLLRGGARLPKTIKRKKRKVLTFQEIPSARLSSVGEKKEIKRAKRNKKKGFFF